MPAGTVQVRVAYCADAVGEVGAVANATTHAPSAAIVEVTPVALSTVVAQAPDPTEAASAVGEETPSIATASTAEQTRAVRRIMGRM